MKNLNSLYSIRSGHHETVFEYVKDNSRATVLKEPNQSHLKAAGKIIGVVSSQQEADNIESKIRALEDTDNQRLKAAAKEANVSYCEFNYNINIIHSEESVIITKNNAQRRYVRTGAELKVKLQKAACKLQDIESDETTEKIKSIERIKTALTDDKLYTEAVNSGTGYRANYFLGEKKQISVGDVLIVIGDDNINIELAEEHKQMRKERKDKLKVKAIYYVPYKIADFIRYEAHYICEK